MPTADQVELGQVQLELAQEFGIGGDQWTVTEANGAVRGTITFYVRKVEQRVPDLSGVGFVTDTRWVGVGPLASLAANTSSNGVLRGRRLTSVADPTLKFYVPDRIDTTRGIVAADLEPLT